MAGTQINVQSIELLGGSSDDVPRQLIDANGVLHPVHEFYYTDVKGVPLFSQSGQQFDADKDGWVKPRQEEPQEGAQDGSGNQ